MEETTFSLKGNHTVAVHWHLLKSKNKVMWQSRSAQKLWRQFLYGQLLKEGTKFSFWETKAD